MKILQLLPSIDPKLGGPCEVVRQLGQALETTGHRTEVATLDDPGAKYLKQFPLPVHALGPGVMGYQYSSRIGPWLREHARGFDCMIVNGLWQYPGLAAWLSARRSRMPYFVFTHGMLDPWFKRAHPIKHLKKWLYWPWAEYQVLRHARAVFFTCERERVLARESFWLYRCNEKVVTIGIARPDGAPEQQRQSFYSAFPALQNKRIFLFLSRIHPKKGCDLLINSFARIASTDARLHLVMAGPEHENYGEQLRKQAAGLGISDRVTWTGMISGDVKWGAFASADAFVLPSHQENFGVAAVEALAAGLPVLISNQINICHEIERDGAGLVSRDDAAGTLHLLQRWLGMPEIEQARMRTHAQACFSRRFEIHSAARSLIESLQANGVAG
jgi:glycosyltransferase involved in cell wall biosynthesis